MVPEAGLKKKCFVVMGFGEKTDYATSRTLDLDKTYRIIIKRAVEEAGLECIRADTVIHSGTIDKPMYELLLEADVVVADLSTSNPNAIYELGVRHALRPNTTIVIAEKQFKFPFDLGHLLIRPYEHLGKGIDSEEADRVRDDLKRAIQALVAKPETDSPVYTFLPRLVPPATVAASLTRGPSPEGVGASAALPAPEDSINEMTEMFHEYRAISNWSGMVRCLKKLLEKRPSDEYLKQQLALATYKSKKPDVLAALLEAQKILLDLKPETTTDPETLGLWGAVHKRLWEVRKTPDDLDVAIRAYEKGYVLKSDYYNGINFAFLLNVRAGVSAPREGFADFVLAERVRRGVIESCRRLLAAGIKNDEGQPDQAQMFWVNASLVEALLGTGQIQEAQALREQAAVTAPESWMPDSMNEQLGKLEPLLAHPPVP